MAKEARTGYCNGSDMLVYVGGKAKEEESKAQQMIELLFEFYMDHPERQDKR